MMIARRIRQFFKQPFDIFFAKKNISLDELRTVCLGLGPYRNLTTLTASIIFLHPNCQVLNHAGMRIFGNNRLNFLKAYSDDVFETFVKYAIRISKGGRRGDWGGSITLSHAFTNPKLKQLYKKRYDDRLVKETIHSFFWKESLRISNFIREHRVDLDFILRKNEKIRFLLPVRNPLDCARSNKRTGKIELFQNVTKQSSLKDLIAAILDEFLWVLQWKAEFPDRFFYFFEHKFNENTLNQLATFLKIKKDTRWIKDCLRLYNIKKSYTHSDDLIAFYNQLVEDKFKQFPSFANELLTFTNNL